MAAPLVEIDDGWDFKVLILDGEWVMRIPRSELSIEELEKEIELLPELGPALPVAIPRFEHSSAVKAMNTSRRPWRSLWAAKRRASSIMAVVPEALSSAP